MNIIDPDTCPITPDAVKLERVFVGAFGWHETEISATWIVEFCQTRGSWRPFPLTELEAFYNIKGHRDFWFNGLDRQGWVVIKDGVCYLTVEFVQKCYEVSPAR